MSMRGRRNDDGEDTTEECIILASSLSSENSSSSSSSSLIAFSLPHFHPVRRFKSCAGTHQSPRSVDLCGSKHLFQIVREKNALDVYDCPGGKGGSISVKDQKIKRFLFNEKPTAVCSSKCGSLVAIGFESGEVSIYERTTGKMRGKFTAHFKRVVKMQFTSDGSSLITCSEDTAVSAWSVCEALKNNDTVNTNNASSSLEPMKSWTSHQLQVTDACCSKSAGAGADLVASCSIDRTARVFSMTHGTGSECLATFGLPKALTAICMDGEDRCIFVGSCDGEIYEMNINGAPVVEMGGGGGRGGGHLHDVESDDADDDDRGGEEEVKEEEDDKEKGNNNKKRRRRKNKNESFTTYRGHDRAIVSLHCTSNGHHLLSTSEDGTCRLWDRASSKCIKTVKHPRGGDAPIASACLAIRSHVEKVIVNVGGSSSNTNTGNTNAQEATITAAARYQKSSSNRQPPDVPLGTFERYGTKGGGGGGGEGGSSNPWDGPLVLL
ncbi:unnamed protein product [Bathycoccus prasinos]